MRTNGILYDLNYERAYDLLSLGTEGFIVYTLSLLYNQSTYKVHFEGARELYLYDTSLGSVLVTALSALSTEYNL